MCHDPTYVSGNVLVYLRRVDKLGCGKNRGKEMKGEEAGANLLPEVLTPSRQKKGHVP